MISKSILNKISLAAGPIAFAVTLWGGHDLISSDPSRAIIAVTLWMAIWWIFEAVPLAATALLPIVLLPLTDVLPIKEVGASYGHKYIFLFLGGFLLALAIEKSKLHWRIALRLILAIGSKPKSILWGFMLSTAVLSMWISNTATTIMMLPMVLAVCSKIEEWEDHSTTFNDHFSKAILLGVAFSASIGGMATLIGSPPNLILAGTIEKTFGESLSFMQWFQAGFPVSVVLLIIAGLYLGRGLNVSNGQVDKSILREQMMDLGPISSDEKRVLIVFLLTALAWMLRSYLITPFLPQLDDTIIALIAALTLFVLPSKENGRLIDWKDAEKLPWGILLLFGGGIALASGFDKTGTASLLAEQLGYLNGMGPEIPYVITVGGINFLTEITSNLATTAVVLPVLAPFAEALGVHPYQLMVGATLAASCAFMLPVGTPPNAIVFSSGKISIQQMVRVGLAMNLISILVITLYTYLLLPLIWSL